MKFPEKLEILLIMGNRTGIKLEAIVTNSAAMTSGEKKLHSLIFDDLVSVVISLDKDWSLYVLNLRLRIKFCMRTLSDFTTIKSFETFPVPSNHLVLLDGTFQNAHDSLVAQIEVYEPESKSVIVRALHLEFLADKVIDNEGIDKEDEYYTQSQNSTIV